MCCLLLVFSWQVCIKCDLLQNICNGKQNQKDPAFFNFVFSPQKGANIHLCIYYIRSACTLRTNLCRKKISSLSRIVATQRETTLQFSAKCKPNETHVFRKQGFETKNVKKSHQRWGISTKNVIFECNIFGSQTILEYHPQIWNETWNLEQIFYTHIYAIFL